MNTYYLLEEGTVLGYILSECAAGASMWRDQHRPTASLALLVGEEREPAGFQRLDGGTYVEN